MPDLNWRSRAVREEMKRIASLWLERGVDGFRLDATRYLVETGSGAGQQDTPETHAALKEFAAWVRRVKPEAFVVGENWADTNVIATYYGSPSVAGGDELPSSFDFPLSDRILRAVADGNAVPVASKLDEVQKAYPAGALDSPFLTNHDQVRLATQLGRNAGRLRNAAAILLTLPGAPFLYYGEEVGIQNGPTGGDESKRTPMPWTASSGGGFTTGTPWFGFAPGRETENVAAQTSDPGSLLSRYRNLIRVRKSSQALAKGELVLLTPVTGASPILAFLRRTPEETVLVAHNLSDNFASGGPYTVTGTSFETPLPGRGGGGPDRCLGRRPPEPPGAGNGDLAGALSGTPRDPWLRVAAILAFLLPVLVLHRTFLRPATDLVAARPDAHVLDDPTTNATAMARAWARFDRGDFRPHDDRVFAPAPNAIALGEYYPLPSLVGYPFARLAGSVPLGVNVPYYLALVSFSVALYVLYARIAGPGLAALLATLLVSWGPSRLNSLGVLNTLATGLGLLALSAAFDWQRTGRPGRLAVFAGLVVAQGFTSLYGMTLTALFGLVAFPLLAGSDLRKVGRLLALVVAAFLAVLPAALYNRPYFDAATTLGVATDRATFEAHAADLLSLLHGGIYGGPVRNLLEGLVPGFPLGAAAFFPTVAVIAALGAYAAFVGRGRFAVVKPPLPWLLVAVAFFVAALGPVIRLAGRPLAPGPYGLMIRLPVLRSLRGIHRFDQPFDIALGAAAALAFVALRRRFPGRALPVVACALVALDAWPADVPSFRFPAATPAATALGSLGADAIVAHYPMGRDEATQAWVDQLVHRRRVVNGWFTFSPLPHRWLEQTLRTADVVVALAALREFGARVVVVDPDRLDAARRAGLERIHPPDAALGLRSVTYAGRLWLFWLEPRAPAVLSLADVRGLVFRGRAALVRRAAGSLVLFFGPEELAVNLVSGGTTRPDRLVLPPVRPSPWSALLTLPVPSGGEVVDAGTGRLLGRGE